MPYSDQPQAVLNRLSPDQKPLPIYILMGEEEYFIDKIEKKIVSTYLPEADAEEEGDESGWGGFNYSLLYGSSCEMDELLAHCRRYPMGGQYRVVVLREAQALLTAGTQPPLSALVTLVTRPNPHLILVVSIKGGKRLNRSHAWVKQLEKSALIVESPRIKDYRLEPYIAPMAEAHGLRLNPAAIQMVANRMGADLQRMDSELEKLATALPKVARRAVTAEMVQAYTGWAKEYSPYDLRKALAYRQVGESMRIAQALGDDEKRAPVQMILPQLFNYFANLFIAFYAPNRRDEGSVMKALGLTNKFFVQEYMAGLKNYSAVKVLDIIKYLRRCDARSKGMYSDEGSSEEILLDLVLFILN